MNKCRVKFLNGTKNEEYILNSIATINPDIHFRNIYIGNMYATLTFTNVEDIPLTLALGFTNKLKEKGLEIAPPPSYHSERTIFISKTQSYITNKPAEDILESINSNDKNTIKACSVVVIQHRNYRPGNSKTLKVTYETPQNADEVLTKGIHVCGLLHTPDQIKK